MKNNVSTIPDALKIAMNLAKTCGLPGAESLVTDGFNNLLNSGD